MTSSDCCIDCGKKPERTDVAEVNSIPDRCNYCSLIVMSFARYDWIEYYMVASGLLEARRK